MRLFGYIIILIVLTFGIVFSVLNADFVVVHYYFGQQNMSLALLAVIAFIFGVIVGMLSMIAFVISLKIKLRKTRHEAIMPPHETNDVINSSMSFGE